MRRQNYQNQYQGSQSKNNKYYHRNNALPKESQKNGYDNHKFNFNSQNYRSNQQTQQLKAEYLQLLQQYKNEEQTYQKISNKIQFLKKHQKDQKQKLVQVIQGNKKLVQERQKSIIKEQEQFKLKKQKILADIKMLENKHRYLQRKQKMNSQVKDMRFVLELKQKQLNRIQSEQSPEKIKKQLIQIKEKIENKKNDCLQLKTKKADIKENIKKLKKKRFEINQEFSKEERIRSDLQLNIAEINQKIKIQAHFDEKLRLQNLKKMEDKQAKKLHPQDLPYEDLRKLKEHNHELKLMLLQVKEKYEEEKSQGASLVPRKSVEQIDSKINKCLKFQERYINIDEQNKKLVSSIKKLKQENKKRQKNRNSYIQNIENDFGKQEEELIDIKATVKVLRKDAETLVTRVRQYEKLDLLNNSEPRANQFSWNNEECSESDTSSKPERALIRGVSLEQSSDKDQQATNSSNLKQKNAKFTKNKNNKRMDVSQIDQTIQQNLEQKSVDVVKYISTKNGKIPVLENYQKTSIYNKFYINKKPKKGQLAFTCTYLILLVVLAYYYNWLRVVYFYL